jgi:hypothetical protein
MAYHHHVLYEIVREAVEIAPGELHDRYDAVAEDVYDEGVDQQPIGERARRNKLRKLEAYDLIDRAEDRHGTHSVLDAVVVSDRVTLPARMLDN